MKATGLILLVTFCILLGTASLHAQDQRTIDSLQTLLNNASEDTTKLKLYVRLISAHLYYDTQEGYKYEEPGIRLAEKINCLNYIHKIMAVTGKLYWREGKYDEAIKKHKEALALARKANDDKSINYLLTAIGQDYGDSGRYKEAVDYFNMVRERHLKSGDKEGLAGIDNLLAWVYTELGNYSESAKYTLESLKLYEELKDDYGYAISAANHGQNLVKLDRHSEAIIYYLRSCRILIDAKDDINLALNYKYISESYSKIQNYPKAFHYAELSFNKAQILEDWRAVGQIERQIARLHMTQGEFDKAIPHLKSSVTSYRRVNTYRLLVDSYSQLGICHLRTQQPALAKEALDSAQYFSQKEESRLDIKDYLYGRQLYDSLSGNWKDAYLLHLQYIGLRDSIFNADNTKKLMQTQLQYEFDKKEAAAKVAQEIKDAIAYRELQRQKLVRNGFILGFAVVMLFAGVFLRQRNRISREKHRSDALLLNILPGEIAEELKAKGSADAKQFDEATVMFTDFQGFTQISERLSPKELVDEIHTCFKAFDSIIGKYNIEKIKTIGDSYMCAGGLPVTNKTHPKDVVRAAIEIQKFMRDHFRQRKAEGKEIFEIRIGIHTGPVVAGIVGVKKFAYDIWGDTVNIAARMEQNSEAGKINISGATHALVRDRFKCHHRGKVHAKNKGEIDMYFVEEENAILS